jgi:two-component system, OmpR family, sensor histidine kinase KdpD
VARGKLRLYLGAAPGVGKTFAMLNEGWRRKERGTDVVVGWVDTHGRQQTAEQLRDLEILPRKPIEYRGQMFEELDLDALLARHPQLALVDELAHTNVPGSRNAKRWQDVEELLDAGINVISTVNLQHLESLNDVVERITGVVQRETVPDGVVRSADQLELVDMSPEALRRRLAHGNVYPAERIDAALGNYFRAGNLTALRELALLWVADRVDQELQDYRERHGIAGPWETKERVVVSLTGAPGGAVLIRRAARMSMRTKAELVGVHVRAEDGLTAPASDGLIKNRALLDELGGRYIEVVGAEVAPALMQVARAENATQLVLGATHRSRLTEFVRGSVVNSVIRASGGSLDIHVIATDAATSESDLVDPETDEADPHLTDGVRLGRRRRLPLSPLSRRRQVGGLIIGIVGFPLATLLLTMDRSHIDLSTSLGVYLILVVAVAVVGGALPAALAAVAGFLLSNYFFAPPIHRLTIADTRDVVALVIFLVVAGVVSSLVDLAGRRSVAAARARADAHMLARVAGRLASPEGNPLSALLDDLVVTFRLEAAAILRRSQEGEGPVRTGPGGGTTTWDAVVAVGVDPPLTPEAASVSLPLSDQEVVALRGPRLTAEDREILAGFTAQLAAALANERLQGGAERADALARANEHRSSLLAAVSHDLRTPLASIKAASSSLLSKQLTFGPEETEILLRTIDDESDRLSSLVENLLDMSRLQTGSMKVLDFAVDVKDVVDAALASLGPRAAAVSSDVPDDLPPVRTDPVLLERAIANLVDNALVHAGGSGLRIEAGAVAGRVDLRVVDHGPGIPAEHRELIFRPFERVGDSEDQSGVGLGLAVARGFVEAVGGDLDVDDTPGGGTTMVVRLPATAQIEHDAGSDGEEGVEATADGAVGAIQEPEPEVAANGKTEESQ